MSSESRVPVFHAGSRCPPAPSAGVTLRGPDGDCWTAGGPCWIHGVLTLSAEEAEEGAEPWLRSLFLAAGTAGGYVYQAGLLGTHGLLGEFGASGDDGRLVLPFQLDINEHLGASLSPGQFFVRVGARHHTSEVLGLECESGDPEPPESSVFSSDAPAEGPVDSLLLACGHAKLGAHAQAVDHYQAALAEETLRADLDRACLYHAAQSASLEDAVDLGLEWLGEDLERRRQAMHRRFNADFYHDLGHASSAERQAAFHRMREAQLGHFRRAQESDPTLVALRERPEFAELFAGTE